MAMAARYKWRKEEHRQDLVEEDEQEVVVAWRQGQTHTCDQADDYICVFSVLLLLLLLFRNASRKNEAQRINL